MSGAGHRIIAAVEMLRSLKADGFSVPLIVELALGKRSLRPDLPVEDRAIILGLYAKEMKLVEAPQATAPPFERAPVNPNQPVFANFIDRWPDPAGSDRDLASRAWRDLSAAEQADAINGIDGWMTLRRHGGFSGAGPAVLYLRDRSWKRTPAVLPAFPLTERTDP